MTWIQFEGLFEICKSMVDETNLHARFRSVYIIFWIAPIKVYRSAEFNIGALVILLVETLCAKSIVGQRKTSSDQTWISAQIKGIMVVTERQIVPFQFSIRVPTIQMNTRICRHKVKCFIQNGQ